MTFGRSGGRDVGVAIVLCVALAGCARFGKALTSAEFAVASATHSAAVEASDARIANTFAVATSAVHAARPDATSPAFRRATLLDAHARGDLPLATLTTHLWQPDPSDAEAYAAYLRVLCDTGRGDEARARAWVAVGAFPDERAARMRVWYETLTAEAGRFPDTAADIRRGSDVSELDAFTGQSSIILKVVRDDDIIGVFKPHQRLRHQSFRGEIASYRLCALIRCTFTIPTNQEAWFTESEFRSLAGLSERDNLRFGTRRTLLPFERDGDEPVIYGTIKAWVPDFTRFPIEYTDVWRPLVSIGTTADELRERSAASVFRELAGRRRGFSDRLIQRAEGMSAYDLGQQVSELHVFDVLINNFDRYQPHWYGMNAHWQQGGFVSIDNGASFFLPHEFDTRAVQRRLSRVETFPRSMIDAIRWMEPEAAFALMFPPNPFVDGEEARFEAFLERRAWLLAYIDALVEEHGEDAVYVFD